MQMKINPIILVLFFSLSCEKSIITQDNSSYIFAWTKDENGFNSDFLSVINTDPNDRAYGSLIATLPVGFNNINAHHSEHRFHSSKQLLM